MSTHENFDHELGVHPPSERSFAWVFTVVFLAAALIPAWHGRPVRWWALGAATLIFVIGLVRPSILRIPNLLWFRFGNLLGRVTSPLVLSLLFFVIFTPIAAIIRLAGKDILRLRRDPQSPSYWIRRDPPGPEPKSMVEQF